MNYRGLTIIPIVMLFMIFSTGSQAEDANKKVTPSHEHKLANQLGIRGPDKTSGIRSVTLLGKVPLEKDFTALKGRSLRARELVIEPGGVVAVHQHDSRPGVAYILQGEIVEHRNDQPEPLLRKQGAVAFEQSGVAHWWENKSGSVVRALVVDIVSDM